MFVTRLCLLAFFTVDSVISDIALSKSAAFSTCYDNCPEDQKNACLRGCEIASALTLAPPGYKHNPSCSDSCNSAFTASEEQEACVKACESYPKSDSQPADSVNTGFTNFAHLCYRGLMRMVHSMRNWVASQFNQPKGDNTDEPVVHTRVRIFLFSRPDDGAELSHISQSMNSLSNAAPSDLLSKQEIEDKQNALLIQPHVGEKMSCALRRVVRDPLKLLILITTATLFVLLIIQTFLHLRRYRSQRFDGYHYAPLPSYAESTEGKGPLVEDGLTEVDIKKPEKASVGA
ncbi:hypothetical protein P879_06746 [Paragonimus westermani]|uniref:Transmembrane protein 59 n=1 Tax=Paragonimus westermani TaxID=34504 RepID=A0A8T0DNX1_9TREM|nr:hypothetical protein P879_06746 [Paragonimus westermani]